MTDLRTAAQQALEALEGVFEGDEKGAQYWTVTGGTYEAVYCKHAIAALKAALELEPGVDPIAVLFGLANNMANNAEILIQALQPYHPLQVVHKNIVQQVTWMQESVDRYHAFAQQWHDAHPPKLGREE